MGTTNEKDKTQAVGIKSMNGATNAFTKNKTESEITIDGLVDVLVDAKLDKDGYSSNSAVSAVASTINIGGGSIKTINDAYVAIQAYGEFVSKNSGIVNLNAENIEYGPKKEGAQTYLVKSFTPGKYKVELEGDLVTVGGMGSEGQINIGLAGKDSYWHGHYTRSEGFGVTPGQLGAVNLKMKDGSHW